MKTIAVKMSDEQAKKFESIAEMMKVDVADLITSHAFAAIDDWDEEPENTIHFIPILIDIYVKKRGVGGRDVEKLLRAGLKEMSLKKLIEVCDEAGEEDYSREPNKMKIAELMAMN